MFVRSSTETDAEYWRGLDQGRLRLPRCAGCGRWQWPAVARCGACGHWGSNWHDLPIRGRIFTWTRTWHPFEGLEALPKPFVTVVAEIDGTDGRRLMGLLPGVEAHEAVMIGAAISGEVIRTSCAGEEVPVIGWRLAGGRSSER